MNARSVSKNGVLHALTRIRQSAGAFTMAIVLTLTFLVSSTTVNAQSNTEGSIVGRVIGGSSVELTGATATLVNKDFNISRTAQVSSVGTFEFPSLPIGNYDVTLKLTGREPQVQNSRVSVGTPSTLRFELGTTGAVTLEKFVVSGAESSPVDVSSTVIGLNIRTEVVDLLPVAQNISAIALLTPGVTQGDVGFFGNLTSFAGASVGENAYYLNGFNITDFRRGLGFSTVPFEFFQEFQVLTSGYSAEFGRSTGGVVNAVSKRGTNNYHASVGIVWEPAGLRNAGGNTFASDGKAYVIRSENTQERRTINLEASGPIWKNHLYFYGLYQDNQLVEELMAPNTTNSRRGISITQKNYQRSDDPYWAAKIDWQIIKDHQFEYTTFSDSRDRVTEQYAYPWTSANNTITLPSSLGTKSTIFRALGGRSNIYRYSGSLFDNVLTISALYGTSTANDTITSDISAQPYATDNGTRLSGVASLAQDQDEREATRVDGVVRFSAFGHHALKFGYDLEDNVAHSVVKASGDGTNYAYEDYVAGTPLANSAVAPAGTTRIAAISVYQAGGDFRVITEAMYVEDNWKLLNDKLVLNLGLRRESFDNRNGNDKTFVKIDDQYAPRISGSYDLKGDGLSKVFGSWGRYYLQIPSNTNVRLAGGEVFYTDYYVLNSIKSDFLPNLGAQIGPRTTTGTGIVPGVETIVNADIAAMYQDEFTLGYERALNNKWKGAIKFIYRDLAETIEDVAVDAALNAYAASKGYNKFEAGGFDYYVLTNPGAPLRFFINMTKDFSGDGIVDYHDQAGDPTKPNIPSIATKEQVILDAKSQGYPKASRKYYAVQLELERRFADKWFANFSYVWSQSYGNYEGSVYSDIGQSDAGITQLFDQPGLVDGSYGFQPNDRRHTFKAYGAYKLTKELTVSGNYSLQSGRPINGLGLHPTDTFARVYGGSSYYLGNTLTPRGSLGRTDWISILNLGLRYNPSWGKEKLSFGFDIFNVLNQQSTTARFERSVVGSAGTPLAFFNATRSIQEPRYMRISASINY